MTTEDLRQLRSILTGLRFIQAAALVESGLNENKQAIEYMRKLSRLTAVIDKELEGKNHATLP